MRACVRAWVRACVRACLSYVYAYVFITLNATLQRRNSHGVVEPVSRYVHTNDLLQCDSFVDLWVHWADGIIRVGEGSTVGVSQFIWHRLESVYPVRAVSLSSGMHYPAQWRMEEDNGQYAYVYYVLLCIIMYYYVLLCIIMYYYVLLC